MLNIVPALGLLESSELVIGWRLDPDYDDDDDDDDLWVVVSSDFCEPNRVER